MNNKRFVNITLKPPHFIPSINFILYVHLLFLRYEVFRKVVQAVTQKIAYSTVFIHPSIHPSFLSFFLSFFLLSLYPSYNSLLLSTSSCLTFLNTVKTNRNPFTFPSYLLFSFFHPFFLVSLCCIFQVVFQFSFLLSPPVQFLFSVSEILTP